MEDLIADLIFEIKKAAVSLREAAEDLESDVNSSPFDFSDARMCLEEVSEHFEKLKFLLTEEQEQE
ncbi:hypothetical protein PI95_031810 [Hassallia byssoidea VB512170]|uniref:Uncharacterized protein n=1 Tax=Hassallia byssoidea VB512170 TaxID=1304833 RepID=A0A846HLZ9_9CYAN|nr:hypothetical protein [Hassalia byssoidea]NEU76961.1 hypothetical protein [Hassalia byssoidea VB512170]